jgi:hypothetical protein
MFEPIKSVGPNPPINPIIGLYIWKEVESIGKPHEYIHESIARRCIVTNAMTIEFRHPALTCTAPHFVRCKCACWCKCCEEGGVLPPDVAISRVEEEGLLRYAISDSCRRCSRRRLHR